MTDDQLDEFIDAAAAVLSLPVEPAWKPGIKAGLKATFAQSALVMAFNLPDAAEPAPVFRA